MLSSPIELQRVRQLFSRPERILDSQFLRREIASRMREKLELVNMDAATVLDAGCGEGSDWSVLQARFPQAQILGIDGSEALLKIAAKRDRVDSDRFVTILRKLIPYAANNREKVLQICGDFSRVALKPACVDAVWSNLALHWHPQPDVVLKEWHRLVRTDGLVMFSCFGPDTLIELRKAFAVVDESPRTLAFVDMHDLGDMLVAAGFATPVMDMERITLRYQDLSRLFSDVRALGGNPLATRRKTLMGRAAYQRLSQQLESMRESDGRIPLTFEVVYGHAFKPLPRKTQQGESIVQFHPKK